MSSKTYAKSFFAFIIGSALGAVVAYLLVPRSGSETREAIRDRLEDIRYSLWGERKYYEEAYTGTHGTEEPPPLR
jgi:gas vesicle protein